MIDQLTQIKASVSDAPRPATKREALLQLLHELSAIGYEFITATPATHARVVARPERRFAKNLRDVLGWSLPYKHGIIPNKIEHLLKIAGVLDQRADGLSASLIRVSTLDGTLFLHSAFPTLSANSVFFGPDSYRFVNFILQEAQELQSGAHILDYGAGSGVGGISAALHQPDPLLTLADINPDALFLSSINAAFAGIDHAAVKAQSPTQLAHDFGLIVTHPPFMMDEQSRTYRDGGDLFGTRLSLEWSLALCEKLRPGGQVIVHTGASIVDGQDILKRHLTTRLDHRRFAMAYRELDPDIFSEDLDQPAYSQVERIAAIGAVITRHS